MSRNLAYTLPDPWTVIKKLRASGHHGIYASDGPWYTRSIFGRDSLMVGRMLLTPDKTLATEIILTISALQGTKLNASTQEEPGRIHHEYRDFSKWGAHRPGKRLAQLASILWGSNSKEMLTYYSTDGTALYVKLTGSYLKRYGADILDYSVTRRDGETVKIEDCIADAANWLVERARTNGYVEHHRTNIWSVVNQTWKDSPTAYLHTDGELPDFTQPVAYLLAQILSADGLEALAPWLGHHTKCNPREWQQTATSLRKQVLESMWMEEEGIFAPLLDRSPSGRHRPARTLSSDAAWTLSTSLFSHLRPDDQRRYLEPLIRQFFGTDFLTPVGIRCRALRHQHLTKLIDYHGSWTSWSVDTYFLALGLRKHGFITLARELELRLFTSFERAGKYYEYFIVTPEGGVVYHPEHAAADGPSRPIQIPPEPNLAWSVASYEHLRRIHDQDRRPAGIIAPWKLAFETEILDSLPYALARGEVEPDAATTMRLSTTLGWLLLGIQTLPTLVGRHVRHKTEKLGARRWPAA